MAAGGAIQELYPGLSGEAGDVFEQVWLIMLFAVIGAAVGCLVYLAAEDASLEDTMIGDYAVARKARDVASGVVDTTAGVTAGAAGVVGDVADRAGGVAGAVKDKLTGDDD